MQTIASVALPVICGPVAISWISTFCEFCQYTPFSLQVLRKMSVNFLSMDSGSGLVFPPSFLTFSLCPWRTRPSITDNCPSGSQEIRSAYLYF
ncbi:hypothetical protein EI94DRAFT_864217 [Lactarius quietus]|nr:hypothetical protein EI94DRAFT_864217 [Lactarius quietus]